VGTAEIVDIVDPEEATGAMQVIRYPIAEAVIAELAEEFLPLSVDGVDDKEGFDKVHDARMIVKGHRVDVEKTRKALKADALAWGKAVDGEAKRLTALLAPIEEHLTNQENIVLAEKERIRKEKAEAARRLLDERLAKLRAVDATVSVLKLESMTDEDFDDLLSGATSEFEMKKAEAAKLAEAQRIEEERKQKELAAQQAEMATRQAEIDAERERLAAIQREQAAAQKKIDEEHARIAAEDLKKRQAAEAVTASPAEPQSNPFQLTNADFARPASVQSRTVQDQYQMLLSIAVLIEKLVVPEVDPELADAQRAVKVILTGAAKQIREAIGDLPEAPAAGNPFSKLS
jgi:chromosome segregation ATPase